MDELNPAQSWRKTLRSGFSAYRPPKESDASEHFRGFVEQAYCEEKDRLARQSADGSGEALGRNSVYLLALVLLTYGRLDVVEDILENIPSPHVPARALARCVQHLLPMEGLDVLTETPAALLWYRTYRDRLWWDESAGIFRWRDG